MNVQLIRVGMTERGQENSCPSSSQLTSGTSSLNRWMCSSVRPTQRLNSNKVNGSAIFVVRLSHAAKSPSQNLISLQSNVDIDVACVISRHRSMSCPLTPYTLKYLMVGADRRTLQAKSGGYSRGCCLQTMVSRSRLLNGRLLMILRNWSSALCSKLTHVKST